MRKLQISSGAYVWYIIINIFTLGSFYFLKIVILKALIDAQNIKEGDK